MSEKRPGAGLEWENQVVLQLVQALLGNVSSAMRGVAAEFDGGNVTVHFAVSASSATLSEEVDDVIADLEGGLWPLTPEVSGRVFVGSPENDGGWEGRQHRLVFLAKADDPAS